jgi:ribosomal protein S18 acetylase RimI-like enzyme
VPGFGVRPLDETTWPDFAGLVERHNGVWGGCWCMAFHAVGWCQFGPIFPTGGSGTSARLPRRSRRGVGSAALAGALAEIARRGGGTVESYPEDSADRSVSASFLHNGTLSLFERHGFERTRQLGKHHWVVTKAVP